MATATKTTEKTRNLGIDLLCCLGVMLLLGLQYIKGTGFLEAPVDSYMAALPIAARWFCLSGAMLLAAGTGYVLSVRKFSGGYFKILIRLAYTYLICSAAGLAVRGFLLREEITLRSALESVFGFTSTETGRIIGMYFALLLAAPFLNAAFHDLKHRKARQAFLVVAALVSTLQPMLMFNGIYLLPAWCKGLFPIAAYIGGAYIRRYSKRKDILSLIIFLLSLCIAQTVVVLSISLTNHVLYCPWLDSMASLPSLCIALSLLGIFHSRKEGAGVGHRFFAAAAGGALGALMLGDVLLECLIPALEERFPVLAIRLWAGLAAVPIIFIVCCALSLMLQFPLLMIRKAIRGGAEEPEEAEDSEAAEDTEETAEEAPEETVEEAEEEADEEEEAPVTRGYVREVPVTAAPVYAQPDPNASATSSRHTITVPVAQPQVQQVRLTQPPPEEHPIGVQEVKLPERRKKDYTLDDILSEQGIAVKRRSDDVDDLIAELTGSR